MGGWILFGVLAASRPADVAAQQLNADPASNRIPDHYIVQLKPGADSASVLDAHGLRPNHVYRHALNGFAGFVPPGQLSQLSQDPQVEAVIPDRRVEVTAKPGSGGTTTTGQVTPHGVARIGAAPGSLSVTGLGIGVAVVDTGIDFNHQDLKANLAAACFTAYTACQDDHGHGTHVGGTVAALDGNNLDVVGVAPKATLYAVKVLNYDGSGSDGTVIAGLDWIAANANGVSPAIRVVNMSLGRPGSLDDNPAYRTIIRKLTGAEPLDPVTGERLGITVVVSAGNDATLEASQRVPSTYPEVMAVASTTAIDGVSQRRSLPPIKQDTASTFTTDGAFVNGIGVTISAPGEDQENIDKAGFIRGVGILSTKMGGGTTRMSGTSMASPHVAGVVALMWEQALLLGRTTLAPEDVRVIIRDGNNVFGWGTAPLDSLVSSYTFDQEREGVISAAAAVNAITPPPAETTDPTTTVSEPLTLN